MTVSMPLWQQGEAATLSPEQLQAQLELEEAEEERGRDDDLLRPSSVPSWLTDDLATSTTNKAPPLQSLPARASASGNEPRGTRGVGVPLIGSGGSGPSGSLHATLPTKVKLTGMPMHLNAGFLLSVDRQNVEVNQNAWNRALLGQLPRLLRLTPARILSATSST